MFAFAAVVFVTVTTVLLLLMGQSSQEQAYGQNQTQVTNFTQLFSTDKEFQLCYGGVPCIPVVDVLYQDPTLLVLKSSYIDTIWKGVAAAQKEGYKIDAVTSYAVSAGLSGDTNVNLLVAMSK